MSDRNERVKMNLELCLEEIQNGALKQNKSYYTKKYKLTHYHLQAMADFGYIKFEKQGKVVLVDVDMLFKPGIIELNRLLNRAKEINPVYEHFKAKVVEESKQEIEAIETVVKLNVFQKISKWFS
jgi:ribosomal protein S8